MNASRILHRRDLYFLSAMSLPLRGGEYCFSNPLFFALGMAKQ